MIHALRWRRRGQEEWQAYKLATPGPAPLACQLLYAPKPVLREATEALFTVLLGDDAAGILGGELPDWEVSLHLSDFAGHVWVAHRRDGVLRLSRDAAWLADGQALSQLLELLGAEAGKDDEWPRPKELVRIFAYEWHPATGGLRRRRLGMEPQPIDIFSQVATEKLTAALQGANQLIPLPGPPDAKALATITALAQAWAPLRCQYRELAVQFGTLKDALPGLAAHDQELVPKLVTEVELLAQLDEVAAPLLRPGVSLPALAEDLNALTGKVAELAKELGLAKSATRPRGQALRQALALKARIEALTGLLRASDQSRGRLGGDFETQYQAFLQGAENGLAADGRPLAADLERALKTLEAQVGRLKARRALDDEAKAPLLPEDGARLASAGGGEADANRRRTWFERLKAAREAEDQGLSAPTPPASADPEVERDLRVLHQATATIRACLEQVARVRGRIEQVRRDHSASLVRLDQVFERRVKEFGKLKDEWNAFAATAGIPTNLDLPQLLQLISDLARLQALEDQRSALATRVQDLQARAARTEALVRSWRAATGSHKTTDLSHQTLLLAETRGLLQYLEPKRRRLEQLKAQGLTHKLHDALRQVIKSRRQELLRSWHEAWSKAALAGEPCLAIHDDQVDHWLQQAERARVIGQLMAPSAEDAAAMDPARMGNGEARTGIEIHLMEQVGLAERAQQEYLAAIQGAGSGQGTWPTLLLIADRAIAEQAAHLGLQPAVKLSLPPVTDAPRAEARPTPVTRPTVPVVAPAVPVAAPRPLTPPMADKARQALEILTGRKP